MFGVQARQELQADFDTFITKLEKHFNTEELHLQSGVCHPLLFCCRGVLRCASPHGLFRATAYSLSPHASPSCVPPLCLTVVAVGRKYWSLEMQVHISKKIWENTPLHKWRVILPFVINKCVGWCCSRAILLVLLRSG